MPKPTFMQTVLRKPTRSYADPNAPSPWSDVPHSQSSYYDPPASRYTASRDNGVFLGYKESRYASNEAGPSRQRGTASVVPDMHVSSRSRFPAPRKAMSAVSLRDEEMRDDMSLARKGTGTVKKKKKKPKAAVDSMSVMSGSVDGSVISSSSRTKPKTKKAVPRREIVSAGSSVTDLAPPPPLVFSSEAGSSRDSSPPIPATPLHPAEDGRQSSQSRRPGPSAIQKAIAAGIIPPLSPPGSDYSSERSRLSVIADQPTDLSPLSVCPQPPRQPSYEEIHGPAAPSIPPKSPKRLSSDAMAKETYTEAVPSPLPIPDTHSQPASHAPPLSMPILDLPEEEAPASNIPSLRFQPPTPAPVPDPDNSPFHPEPVSPTEEAQARSQSLFVDSYTLAPTDRSSTTYVEDPEDDAHSATGEVGSDHEGQHEMAQPKPTSRSSSFSKPHPVSVTGSRSPAGSRSPSVVWSANGRTKAASRPASTSVFTGDELRPPSRASSSRHASRNSFEDFAVRRRGSAPMSEISYALEGSVSGISGYGKGGWAAAHASRSGATTPVTMFMPSGGNDGWASFQQPVAPPRQSRFTPLPPSSQPKTFNAIVHGESAQGSIPSSYSQGSDSSEEEEDNGPKPSRSYRTRVYESESGYPYSQDASFPPIEDRFSGSLRQRQLSLGPAVDPYAVPCLSRPGSVVSSVPPPNSRLNDAAYQPNAQRRYSLSPTAPQDQFDSRPASPAPPRPASRVGFEPPSFLNPDTLTVLPEMTAEDSARTYGPSEAAKSHRRSGSVFGGRSRGARSEIGVDEDEKRSSVLDLPKRAKSAIGHRGDLSRWEGTSVGEGVLLESHGRDESVKGYSNLILPTGAFKPTSANKTSATVDSRILGMPHTTMAAIVLSTLPHRDTPIHLRDQTPPVDFSSQLRPPTKVGNAQVLIQVYATAVDELDIRSLDDKTRGDIGKWVPARSFVGRCMTVGSDEKDIVRGDIVVGIVELKKSGALAEYIVCDRRRLARAPHPTNLTLEQLALLPLQGIAAARAVRARLVKGSRALITGAHHGVPALVCQEMSRAGVHVTAVISGGDGPYAQNACMANGARGVLTGSPAGIMLGMDEEGWDFVLDTQGGQRVYDAAKRMLKQDGTLFTLIDPALNTISTAPVHSRTSGFKTLKAAFSSRKKDVKRINFEYLPPTASGEPAVDASGLDCRDVLEESCMSTFRPVLDPLEISPLDRGMDVFKRKTGGVVRLIN